MVALLLDASNANARAETAAGETALAIAATTDASVAFAVLAR